MKRLRIGEREKEILELIGSGVLVLSALVLPGLPLALKPFLKKRGKKEFRKTLQRLDEKRVVVEAQDEPIINSLKKWGFKPILCNFRNFNTFGGSFHCATADIRRRGELHSYF